MKLLTQFPLSGRSAAVRSCSRPRTVPLVSQSLLHTTPPKPATVIGNLTATGPPPTAPLPSAEYVDSRIARRRNQAELLKRGQDLRNGGSAKQKRFWKDVVVKRLDGEARTKNSFDSFPGSLLPLKLMLTIYDFAEGLQVYLDKRPLRRPTKEILTVPHSKPHLASAIALEWDLLVSAQQALKHHLIPMTSLVSRALDIADEDAAGKEEIRSNIVKTVMRYLDTDSLLCWAPDPSPDPPGYDVHVSRTESLRSIQERTAMAIIGFLREKVWPGIEIVPVLDGDSIVPKSQPQMTQDIIKGWITGLPAFELAGLERGVLAGKGLLGAVRLLVEWSSELAHLRDEAREKFGVEQAAQAASLEVDWQIRMWGAVEDTHDVDREDIRRQLGSVVLLVSGQGE